MKTLLPVFVLLLLLPPPLFAQEKPDAAMQVVQADNHEKQNRDLEISVRLDKDRLGDFTRAGMIPIVVTLKNITKYKIGVYDDVGGLGHFTFYSVDKNGGKTRVFPPSPKMPEHFSGAATILAAGESRSYNITAPMEIFAVKERKFVAGMEEAGVIDGNKTIIKTVFAFSELFSFPELKQKMP